MPYINKKTVLYGLITVVGVIAVVAITLLILWQFDTSKQVDPIDDTPTSLVDEAQSLEEEAAVLAETDLEAASQKYEEASQAYAEAGDEEKAEENRINAEVVQSTVDPIEEPQDAPTTSSSVSQ